MLFPSGQHYIYILISNENYGNIEYTFSEEVLLLHEYKRNSRYLFYKNCKQYFVSQNFTNEFKFSKRA